MPGLRREEVALLAGVSVDYYTRLERGNAAGVSDTVLEALARALQLDGTEREHLFDLARATQATAPRRRRRGGHDVRPAVQQMIDAMTGVPAFVRNGRLDILGANGSVALSTRSTSTVMRSRRTRPATSSSTAVPRASTGNGIASPPMSWRSCARKRGATRTTASSRTSSGSSRPAASSSERSGRHTTSAPTTPASKRVRHPLVGELDLSFEAMELVADPGLTMFVYTAEPGSRSEQALNLLASWSRHTR